MRIVKWKNNGGIFRQAIMTTDANEKPDFVSHLKDKLLFMIVVNGFITLPYTINKSKVGQCKL